MSIPPAPPAPPATHPHKGWVVALVFALSIAAGAVCAAISIAVHAPPLAILGAVAVTFIGVHRLLLSTAKALGLTL